MRLSLEMWFSYRASADVFGGDVGERKVGDQVNLERAMGAHVRFGGHFVQVSLFRSGNALLTCRLNETMRHNTIIFHRHT